MCFFPFLFQKMRTRPWIFIFYTFVSYNNIKRCRRIVYDRRKINNTQPHVLRYLVIRSYDVKEWEKNMINRSQLFQNRALQLCWMYTDRLMQASVHMPGRKGKRREFKRLLWFFVSVDFCCDCCYWPWSNLFAHFIYLFNIIVIVVSYDSVAILMIISPHAFYNWRKFFYAAKNRSKA